MTLDDRDSAPAEAPARRTILGMPAWGFVLLVTLAGLVLGGSIVLIVISGGVPPQDCDGTPLSSPAGCFR